VTKKTIGIIAPLIDRQQLHANFNLKLSLNNRELTLAALYEFAVKGYNAGDVSRGISHEENIPAAGYYLEGLLHQQGYDTILTNKYDAATLEKIAREDPFAVLVSTSMIVATESLLELFSSIRSAMPGTKIIAGGAFIWKNYLLHLDHSRSPQHYPLQPWMLFNPGNARMDADILVVAPHGRSSLLEVLAMMEKGSSASFGQVRNLALPGSDGFLFTLREEEQVDYNEDYTRWDLVSEIPDKIPLRTSIGCPFRCRFCDFYKLFPHIFIRSPQSLATELRLVKARLGQRSAIIHVSDDNVFINRKRLHEVCTTIAESGLRKWIGFMRGGEYSDTEMALIERSGLMLGLIGVESGDPGQLERMNKRQDIARVKRGVEQLDAHGISTLMTFVVGFPGETQQSLRNTADFLNSLSLSNALSSYQMYPLLIQPLSQLVDPSVRAKWKIEGFMENWSHYTMKSEDTVEASYTLFREVTNVPYHYFEESNFFNKAKFSLSTRKLLFQLRQQLTIRLIENAPWDQIEPILRNMAQQMNVSVGNIEESLRNSISVPNPIPFRHE
jgi:anaerobic magnesium-protoporphyrin IX monomethyl ester cyclase